MGAPDSCRGRGETLGIHQGWGRGARSAGGRAAVEPRTLPATPSQALPRGSALLCEGLNAAPLRLQEGLWGRV